LAKTLAINEDGLAQIRSEFRVVQDKDLAERLGVNKATVSRILQGKAAPGPQFIAAMLVAFPIKFEAIFDVVVDDALESAAA